MLLADLDKAYSEKSPTLSDLERMYGDGSSALWVKTQLLTIDFASATKESANEKALNEFSNLFVRQYHYIKLTEFILFVARFKLGRYGKFYGYFDTITIGEAFRKFLKDRSDELDIIIRNRNNRIQEQQAPVERNHQPPDDLRAKLKLRHKTDSDYSVNPDSVCRFLFCLLLDSGLLFKDLLVTDEKRYTIMKPRKQLIDAAVANGSIDRMNMLLSASHLLNCEANSLVEEASDLMTENGLLLGNLKKLHNDFVRVADKYFKEFATLVTTDTAKMDMFSDLDGFDSAFREWAKVPNDWKPKEIEL